MGERPWPGNVLHVPRAKFRCVEKRMSAFMRFVCHQQRRKRYYYVEEKEEEVVPFDYAPMHWYTPLLACPLYIGNTILIVISVARGKRQTPIDKYKNMRQIGENMSVSHELGTVVSSNMITCILLLLLF